MEYRSRVRGWGAPYRIGVRISEMAGTFEHCLQSDLSEISNLVLQVHDASLAVCCRPALIVFRERWRGSAYGDRLCCLMLNCDHDDSR